MENKQTKGLNRNTIDKYYTSDNAVNICITYINKCFQINKDDVIIEPSAGNGSFIKAIKQISNNYKFYDLEPENSEIIKQDYLSFDYKNIKQKYDKIHIIGNPPFGRQSSLAIKFIKKSCEFCDTISFILPKSFKKDSLKNKFPLNFHLSFENDLPDNSFLVYGIEYDVPCVFQIWEKKDHERIHKEKLEPLHFTFVKKNEDPDISFRRVGVNAGNIDINTSDKSIQSHYFIKFNNRHNKTKNIDIFKKLDFDFNNSVGPKSISKQELLHAVNDLLQ